MTTRPRPATCVGGVEVGLVLAGLLCAAAAAAAAAPAERFDVDLAQASARVEFQAAAWPTALLVHGVAERLEGRFEVSDGVVSGRAAIDLAAFQTGIELRDRHMRETYLETARFPQALLELTALRLPGLPDAPDYAVKSQAFEARLTLHGVTRALRGVAQFGRRGGGVEVDAEFEVSLREHGIAVPSYLGLTVADKVRVKVRFSAAATPARAGATR